MNSRQKICLDLKKKKIYVNSMIINVQKLFMDGWTKTIVRNLTILIPYAKKYLENTITKKSEF